MNYSHHHDTWNWIAIGHSHSNDACDPNTGALINWSKHFGWNTHKLANKKMLASVNLVRMDRCNFLSSKMGKATTQKSRMQFGISMPIKNIWKSKQ